MYIYIYVYSKLLDSIMLKKMETMLKISVFFRTAFLSVWTLLTADPRSLIR